MDSEVSSDSAGHQQQHLHAVGVELFGIAPVRGIRNVER